MKPWRPWRRPPGKALKPYMIEMTRWHIAWTLNRLPGQCWSDLVMWVLAEDERRWSPRAAWSPVTRTCVGGWTQREGEPPAEACYCGKVCPWSSDRIFEKAGGVR